MRKFIFIIIAFGLFFNAAGNLFAAETAAKAAMKNEDHTAKTQAAESAAPSAPLPYLVALDFTADPKNVRLGKQIARMFRNKTFRAKVCSVDTEIDWEERAEAMPPPAAGADMKAVSAEAAEIFACDYLVWGTIKSARPEDPKSRELAMKCWVLDVRQGKIAVEQDFSLGTNFELSQAVDEVVKAFTGVPTRKDIAAADPANYQEAFGPNLCPYGNLVPEIVNGQPTLPGWEFPRPDNVTLRRGGDGANFLSYDVAAGEIAEITGLFCYTPYIKIKPGVYYQVSFMVKTTGSKVIQFTKGYRDMEAADVQEKTLLRQETFKHQVRYYGEDNVWTELRSRPFLPRAVKPGDQPEFLRVQLYAYWPVGKVEFKNIVVRECRAKAK